MTSLLRKEVSLLHSLILENNSLTGSTDTVTITGIGNYICSCKVKFNTNQTTTNNYTTDTLNASVFHNTSMYILTIIKYTKFQRIDNYLHTGNGYFWTAIKNNGTIYYVLDEYLTKAYILF